MKQVTREEFNEIVQRSKAGIIDTTMVLFVIAEEDGTFRIHYMHRDSTIELVRQTSEGANDIAEKISKLLDGFAFADVYEIPQDGSIKEDPEFHRRVELASQLNIHGVLTLFKNLSNQFPE